ncbi:MAG: hypothetical protein ACJ8AO_21365 [Gemmatimonadaceae bacterium]
MTARDRVIALRRTLTTVLVVRAVAFGAAVALSGVALAHALALPWEAAAMLALTGVIVTVVLAARVRPAQSLERVALWVEERHPTLRYALVTAAAGGPAHSAVEQQALQQPWWDEERQRLLRALRVPVAALAAATALAVWRPVLLTRDAASTSAARARAGATGSAVDPLAGIRVVVTPPAYSGRQATTSDDPTSVDALVGSSVVVSGAGEASRVTATLDSAARGVAPRDGRWSTSIVMPARPSLLRLRSAAGRERLVVLAPVPDAAPVVTLLLPARDTVVRAAAGTLLLRAALRDDIGLRDAAFEIIVSSGQEENFTFRTATLARSTLGGRQESALDVRLSLDSLGLKPGDVLQMRAVAHDANTVSGPGLGSSETRALRVARAGEYDSVSVDPAPPGEPEGQVLSQRMLITLTEALDKRRPRLARPTLVSESQRIAADQARLRKRVGDIVFQRIGGEPLSEESNIDAPVGKLTPEELLARAQEATKSTVGDVMDVEGDETPILAVNKPLLEAFNAMWDAGRALEIGETRQALPPMRRALAAIQRARQAERIYLRGRPSAVVVDVAHARLAGKDKGIASEREPRPMVDLTQRRRAESFARATALLATDPAAAADTLLVMRVGALEDTPALAAALDTAARTIRRGDTNAIALAWTRVRRALGGAPVVRGSLPAWSGAP